MLLYLRSPKGGCCSISDDLSCGLVKLVMTADRISDLIKHASEILFTFLVATIEGLNP